MTLKKIHVIDGRIHGEVATISDTPDSNIGLTKGQEAEDPDDPKSLPLSVFFWSGWIHTSPQTRESSQVFQVELLAYVSTL